MKHTSINKAYTITTAQHCLHESFSPQFSTYTTDFYQMIDL